MARNQNPERPRRTLPLYPYPAVTRYKGSGDPYEAESYEAGASQNSV